MSEDTYNMIVTCNKDYPNDPKLFLKEWTNKLELSSQEIAECMQYHNKNKPSPDSLKGREYINVLITHMTITKELMDALSLAKKYEDEHWFPNMLYGFLPLAFIIASCAGFIALISS